MQDYIHRNRLDSYGLLNQPVKELAAVHRFAPVKPEGKFIQSESWCTSEIFMAAFFDLMWSRSFPLVILHVHWWRELRGQHIETRSAERTLGETP